MKFKEGLSRAISKTLQEGAIYIASLPPANIAVDVGRDASQTPSLLEKSVKKVRASSASFPVGFVKSTPF